MKVQEIAWWEIGLAWIAANSFGIFVGAVAGGLLNANIWPRTYCADNLLCMSIINYPIERMLISGLCIGFFVGIFERFVLPQLSPWWILFSTIGWGVGLASAESIKSIHVSGAIAGTIIGCAKWVILRRYVPSAFWWVVAHAVNGLVFPAMIWLAPNFTAVTVLYSPLSFVKMGVTSGVIPAATLVWLSRLPFNLSEDNDL